MEGRNLSNLQEKGQFRRNDSFLNWLTSAQLPARSDGTTNLGIAGAVSGIIDNFLIIAGGTNFKEKFPWDGGKKNYENEGYVYKISDGKLELISQQKTDVLVAYAGNCSIKNTIYFAGGENGKGPVDTFYKLYLKDGLLVLDTLPKLPLALTGGGLTIVSNMLYFIGGQNGEYISNKIYSFDISSSDSQWKEYLELPHPVTYSVVTSNRLDTIYIAGGRKPNENGISTFYSEILEVKVKNKVVRHISNLPRPLAAGTGVLDKTGNLLIFGGDGAGTFNKVESIIAEIKKTSDPAEVASLTLKKNNLLKCHSGFTTDCWLFNTFNRSWTELSHIDGESPVMTSALKHKDWIFIPSGEVKAGIRTDKILIGKIKT